MLFSPSASREKRRHLSRGTRKEVAGRKVRMRRMPCSMCSLYGRSCGAFNHRRLRPPSFPSSVSVCDRDRRCVSTLIQPDTDYMHWRELFRMGSMTWQWIKYCYTMCTLVNRFCQKNYPDKLEKMPNAKVYGLAFILKPLQQTL